MSNKLLSDVIFDKFYRYQTEEGYVKIIKNKKLATCIMTFQTYERNEKKNGRDVFLYRFCGGDRYGRLQKQQWWQSTKER